MRKTKWLNFQGSVLAASTLAVVAAGVLHAEKKYGGKKSSLISFDKEYLANYAFDRLLLNNDKLTTFIHSRLAEAKNK